MKRTVDFVKVTSGCVYVPLGIGDTYKSININQMLLDTGASVTTLSCALLQSLGYSAKHALTNTVIADTASGQQIVLRPFIVSCVKFGSLLFQNFPIYTAYPKDNADKMFAVKSLLGTNILSLLTFTVNYNAAQVEFTCREKAKEVLREMSEHSEYERVKILSLTKKK